MKDKFLWGLIFGSIAGVIMNTSNLTLYYLDLSTLRYLDWTSVLILGHKPNLLLEGIWALFLQLGLASFIGVIFLYSLPKIGLKYYLLKGAIFGGGIDIFNFFIANLFKVEGLADIPIMTAISLFLTSTGYGIVLSFLSKHYFFTKK